MAGFSLTDGITVCAGQQAVTYTWKKSINILTQYTIVSNRWKLIDYERSAGWVMKAVLFFFK